MNTKNKFYLKYLKVILILLLLINLLGFVDGILMLDFFYNGDIDMYIKLLFSLIIVFMVLFDRKKIINISVLWYLIIIVTILLDYFYGTLLFLGFSFFSNSSQEESIELNDSGVLDSHITLDRQKKVID